MRQADGLNLYYMYNGHADVTALVDASSGNVRATYYYDAFGNIQEEKYYTASGQETNVPINNNIMYAGYQYDKETGLYYLNARMYDPKVARFLQEDTYRGTINDPLTLNLYTYCANNPITYVDPTGHVIGYFDENGKWVGYTGSCNPSAGYHFGWIGNFFAMTNSLTGEQTIIGTREILGDGTVVIGNNRKTANEALNAPLVGANYMKATAKHFVLGDYTEEVTLLGIIIQIGLGFTGLDLPGDIRDLSSDIVNWKSTPEHILKTIVDAVALAPIIGSLKYGDEVAILFKKGDKVVEVVKKVDETTNILAKNSDEIAEIIKKVEKADDLAKNSDKIVEVVKKIDKAGDLAKNGDEAATVIKKADKAEAVMKNSDEAASAIKKADEVAEQAGRAEVGKVKPYQMSNAELVQEMANRENNTMNRKLSNAGKPIYGSNAGTKKHSYAAELLNKYQKLFGDRSLEVEKNWLNNASVNGNLKGSVRLDVYDRIIKKVYDYKFVMPKIRVKGLKRVR